MIHLFRTCMFLLSAATIISSGCNTPLSISSRKPAHQQYSDGLKDAGLTGTALATGWMNAAEKSLTQPAPVTLPYREKGYFPAELPSAAGFRFTAKRGEVINIRLDVTAAGSSRIFTEIWQLDGNSRELLAATDSLPGSITHEIKSDGSYTLRIQPELLHSVGYELNISSSPSLAFPVRPRDNPRASSFWGADRDGGRRSHEGVDIFAKKGTPAIAIADGRVIRVNENQLGGKVVFMRPEGKDISLYYAHLDSQLVSDGQWVRQGDVIGLIGNTGNARTTPAHLHFGIYAGGGAIDPWPFINVNNARTREITSDSTIIRKMARVTAQELRLSNGSTIRLPAGSSIRILAATGDQFRVGLPDGNEGFLPAKTVSTRVIRQAKLKLPVPLLSEPMPGAAVKNELAQGTAVMVLARWQDFHYIRHGQEDGWISNSSL